VTPMRWGATLYKFCLTDFSLRHRVQTVSGFRPDYHPMGTGAISLEVKLPWSEAGHSSLFSAEVKNA
jgi:hypothetical protein